MNCKFYSLLPSFALLTITNYNKNDIGCIQGALRVAIKALQADQSSRTLIQLRLLRRMIQVERESAELRSDELESRVNSGSMDGLNVTLRPRALPTSATAQSLASSCSPPTSGHSTPKHHQRNASHHLGIMTLVRHQPQRVCVCVCAGVLFV